MPENVALFGREWTKRSNTLAAPVGNPEAASEATEMLPPWMRPPAPVTAERLLYDFLPEDKVELLRVYGVARYDAERGGPRLAELWADFHRLFTRRGRLIRLFKLRMRAATLEHRFALLAFEREKSEHDQATHIADWLSEFRRSMDADLMSDMRTQFPDATPEELKAEIASWSRRARFDYPEPTPEERGRNPRASRRRNSKTSEVDDDIDAVVTGRST